MQPVSGVGEYWAVGKFKGRGLLAALAALSALTLVGCAATVDGVAMLAAAPSPTVAALDTGNYPTTAGHPFGAAGRDGDSFEGRRIAEYVTGPWQAKATLLQLDPLATIPLNHDTLSNVFSDPLPAVAVAHGLIAGFSSARSTQGTDREHALLNAVLRFPDIDSAAAAAGEMAAKNPVPAGDPAGEPVAIDRHPQAAATAYRNLDGSIKVESFTAHGPFVLFQSALSDPSATGSPLYAQMLVESALDDQEPLIDRFPATDPAKLADLPKDPTGQLLARTLWAPDDSAPANIGVWPTRAWLHYETDPIAASALLSADNVDVVSQRLTTVYQARDASAARHLVIRLAAQMEALPEVHASAAEVPGFPGARCFVRVNGYAPTTYAMSFRRIGWHFKCVAQADRYAFTAFSDQERDVKQQMSAQYRILAGK